MSKEELKIGQTAFRVSFIRTLFLSARKKNGTLKRSGTGKSVGTS